MTNYERFLSLQQDSHRLLEVYSSARWALSVKPEDSLVSSDEAKLILNSKTLEVLDFDTIFNTVGSNLKREVEDKACALFHRIRLTRDLDWVHFWHGGEQQVYIVPNHIFDTVEFLAQSEQKQDSLVEIPGVGRIPLNLVLVREEHLPKFFRIPGVGEPLVFNKKPSGVFLRRIYAPLMPLYLTMNRRAESTSNLGPAKIFELPSLKCFIESASMRHRGSLATSDYPQKEEEQPLTDEQIVQMAALARKLFRVYKDIVCIAQFPAEAYSTLSVMWAGATNAIRKAGGWISEDPEFYKLLRTTARYELLEFSEFTHQEFVSQSLSEHPPSEFILGWGSHLGLSALVYSDELGPGNPGYDVFFKLEAGGYKRHSETLLSLKELLPLTEGSKTANLKLVPKDASWSYYTERTDDLKQLVEDLGVHGVSYIESPAEFLSFTQVAQIMQQFMLQVRESENLFVQCATQG